MAPMDPNEPMERMDRTDRTDNPATSASPATSATSASPATPATPASPAAPATPASPSDPSNPNEGLDLKALFASQIRGPAGQRRTTTLPSSKTLKDFQQKLAVLYGESPAPTLTSAERDALQGKRTPLLPEILEQSAASLEGRPDVVQGISAPPALFRETAQRDRATGRFIQGAQQVARGAAGGSRLASDRMMQMCDEVLAAVLRKAEELKASRDLKDHKRRAALLSYFSEAFRVRRQMMERDRKAQQVNSRNAQPFNERIDQARQHTEDTQLIEKFMEEVKQI